MNNIFLIVSNDKITLDDKIQELLKKYPDSEVVNYDLIETPVNRLIEDLDTFNFLSNKKIVIGTNAFFLSSDKAKSDVDHNIELLEHYLDNPNPDNTLILVTGSIDKRKKITSTLLKKAEVIEEIKDINKLITSRLEDYKMEKAAIDKLIEYCMNDHERIINELDKLKLYKIEEKEITVNDVTDIVMQTLDDNIFHLVDSILSKNKEYAFKLYHNFRLHSQQVASIIPLISSKIRLMYQVKILVGQGNSDKSISQLLKVHEYPVKLAREASYRYSEKTLLTNLKNIAEIDLLIKSGKSTGEVEFETMLATI